MLAHVVARSGGIETALVDLAKTLIDSGHRVSVYACRPFAEPNQNVAALRAAGARLRACPSWLACLAGAQDATKLAAVDTLLALLTPIALPLALVDALVRRRSVRRSLEGVRGLGRGLIAPRLDLRRLYYLPLGLRLPRNRPDVVHIHGWGCGDDPPGALAWTRARGLPTVYTEHNSPPAEPGDVRLTPSPLDLADAIIACSEAGARGLRAGCGTTRPITVIPYSVADPTIEASAALPPPGEGTRRPPTITCLARLSQRHKGQDLLLLAMKQLLAQASNVRLLMAGEGESRAALEAQASDLGIRDSVTFLGNVPRARLPWLMAESDIMVLPSRWEGLPVSIIEAMAFGKPVVASDAGGNPELVVDGQTGLVVPIGDVDRLCAAMLELLNDPERRSRMCAAARQRFEAGGFAPSAVAAATLDVYRSAMAAHGRAAVHQDRLLER